MSSGQRNSVAYDARRIRAPPERHLDHLLPRVVSDDIIQRQKQPIFTQNAPDGNAPDGFNFGLSHQQSPVHSAHASLRSVSQGNTGEKGHYDVSVDHGISLEMPLLPVFTRQDPSDDRQRSLGLENPGASLSFSRVMPQLPTARRYSSYPAASGPGNAQKVGKYAPHAVPEVFVINKLKTSPQHDTLDPTAGLFNFCDADDSVLEVSPDRTKFWPSGNPLNVLPPAPASPELVLPPKSVTSSLNWNVIGLIISTYHHSLSLLVLAEPRAAETKTHPLSATPALQNVLPERAPASEPIKTLPNHVRQDSLSSAVSLALSATLTPGHNQQQRFVRYAMSTQAQAASSMSSRWAMEHVLDWLESHGFPDTWKETFRRNEISGNRFLELGNYDGSSPVWRQLSHTLGPDGNAPTVDRFISLLAAETRHLDVSTGHHTPSLSLLEVSPYSKLENRKSLSTLWTQATPIVPTKQRPFSYIEPGHSKPQKEHTKFFRKHSRLLSGDSGKYPATPHSSQSKSSSEASLSLGNLGFKKSGILSTLRKYGGEKAAGIVKQVQSNPSASTKSPVTKRVSSAFLGVLQKRPEANTHKLPDGTKLASQGSSLMSHEDSRSPSSLRNFSLLASDDTSVTVPIARTKLSQRLSIGDLVLQEHLPEPLQKPQELLYTILLTRDNNAFVPFSLDPLLLYDIDSVKKKMMRRLEMLDIGTITYHLTDFDARCGAALTDDLLIMVLRQGLVTKLKLEQDVSSSEKIGTFSSTSSDSKSFDTSAGDRMYPATPQYLLQQSNDKGVDYMNFKDTSKNKGLQRESDAQMLSLYATQERVPTNFHPINLSFPQLKRAQQRTSEEGPPTNKRGLPLINTAQPPALSIQVSDFGPKSSNYSVSKQSPPSSFTIVRREGREIDFDKRRMNPTESKVPRLIPNIYSSSVADSSISPISASTIHALKDDVVKSPASLTSRASSQTAAPPSAGLDLEKTGNFVARRKAPPPPFSASNSLKINKKKSLGALSILSGSNRSDVYSLSNDSIGSFGSSQVGKTGSRGVAKKFDFSDAPSLELPNSVSRDRGSDNDEDFDDEDDDDDGFFKPLPTPQSSKTINDQNLQKERASKNDLVSDSDSVRMRPSVDEVYDNLGKYFPDTILDKPIIDAYPESPIGQPVADATTSKSMLRKPPISRTFSNANLSPVNPEHDKDDQVLYGDGPPLSRRMKTIRAVANEAHRKRLASLRAGDIGRPARKQSVQNDVMALTRTNTKLWGQKVVEVTSDDIEKGIVGRIRKTANKTYEEFAWVKGELIGRGSFGSVFLALNVTTGEMLAVKQVNVNPSARSNTDGIDAFYKEVETMKDLDHLNIVQYLGFEKSKLTYSLFLEYVAGGSVSSCLKTYGKFDEPLVKFITKQVLEGLKYLHENGILHRDLKADNLLLEIDGVCKISDFGISKRSQDIYSNNAEMSMQGTVFWMAPEVIHSMVEETKQGYSAKVDIWSLGCVVLEMFAGQRPWSNEAVVSAIYKLGKTKLAPPIPTDISQEAKDFLNKCFTIDSEKRPTAAELLEHEFMKPDSDFHFSQTRLSEVIKSSTPKNMVKQ